MKLRNKKTGEITKDVCSFDTREFKIGIEYENSKGQLERIAYNSITELNEEWEDYEELEEYWHINTIGEVGLHTRTNGMTESENLYIEDCQLEIGNYFKTKEEAKKAVEKLKAWKRLKVKGFKVDLWDYDGGNYQERIKTGRILFRVKDYEENDKDLDLLFGGEE